MSLADIIRCIRRRRKETMVQFAQRLGVSHPAVSGYESGRIRPSPSVLLHLLPLAETDEEKQSIIVELQKSGIQTLGDAKLALSEGLATEDDDIPVGLVQLAQHLRRRVQNNLDVQPILLELLDLEEKHGSDPRFSDFWSRLIQFIDRELEERLGRRPLRQPKYMPPPEPGGPPYSKDDPRYENQILWVMTYCYYDKKPFWTGFTTTQKHYEHATIPDMRAVCPHCQISQVWNRDNAWLALPGSQR